MIPPQRPSTSRPAGPLRPVRLALLTVAGALLLASCGTESSSQNTAPDSTAAQAASSSAAARAVPVEVLTTEPRSFRDLVQVTGTVEALHDATISAEVGGRLESIATLGQQVEEGERIAGVNDRLLQASLEAAEAQYRLAQETFERQQALYRDSIISAAEYDNALAQRDQARAQVTQAREQLENAQPRSPFQGRVEERFSERGEYVAPGQSLVRVVDTRTVKVVAGVPERYISDIRAGTEVRIRFRGRRDSMVHGTIDFAGRTVDPDSRTFPIEVELGNPDQMLAPEMIADLFVTRTVLEDVLVVPQSAIVRDEDDGSSVFVVDQSVDPPVARQRVIGLGPTSNGLAVVESGLTAGVEVLVAGQSQVTDGDPVRVTGRQQLAAGPAERGGLLD